MVWAGTIGAVAGPNLTGPAEHLGRAFGLAPDTGPFVLALLTFAVALVILGVALRPDPLLLARSAALAASLPASPPPTAQASTARVLPERDPAAPALNTSDSTASAPSASALDAPAPAAPASAAKGEGTLRTAWRTLRDTPVALRALITIAVSHTAMVSVMSMTPVHLDHGGATYTVIGIVISLHIAGMYIFSPWSAGWPTGSAGSR